MGPSLKVDVHTGAIAELVLTFGISFFSLLVALKGPRNAILQAFLLAVVISVFVISGSAYTGPSMNPANVSLLLLSLLCLHLLSQQLFISMSKTFLFLHAATDAIYIFKLFTICFLRNHGGIYDIFHFYSFT